MRPAVCQRVDQWVLRMEHLIEVDFVTLTLPTQVVLTELTITSTMLVRLDTRQTTRQCPSLQVLSE